MSINIAKLRKKGSSHVFPLPKEVVESIKRMGKSFYLPTQNGANIYTQNDLHTSQPRNPLKDGSGYIITIPGWQVKELKLVQGTECELEVVSEPGSAVCRVHFKRKMETGTL